MPVREFVLHVCRNDIELHNELIEYHKTGLKVSKHKRVAQSDSVFIRLVLGAHVRPQDWRGTGVRKVINIHWIKNTAEYFGVKRYVEINKRLSSNTM